MNNMACVRFGVYGVDGALNAGLDLEMPGTNKWRTIDQVSRAVTAMKVSRRTVKERARKVLELAQRCAREAPEVRGGLQMLYHTWLGPRADFGSACTRDFFNLNVTMFMVHC
jgi:hypothetical protein